MNAQQTEIRKLKDEVYRLQSQCNAMQVQMERMVEQKKGFFKWKKLGMHGFGKSMEKIMEQEGAGEVGFGRETPMDMKNNLVSVRTPQKWRKSMS